MICVNASSQILCIHHRYPYQMLVICTDERCPLASRFASEHTQPHGKQPIERG